MTPNILAPAQSDAYRLAAVLELFPRCVSCGREIHGDATLASDGRRAVCAPSCGGSAA
jgi:hypothetical protein